MCLRFSAAHITLLIPLSERKNSWGQTGSSQQVPGSGQSLLWLHGGYQNRGRSLAFLPSYIITQLKSFQRSEAELCILKKNKQQKPEQNKTKKPNLFLAEGLVLFRPLPSKFLTELLFTPDSVCSCCWNSMFSSQVWTQNATALRHQGWWASSQELSQDSRGRN